MWIYVITKILCTIRKEQTISFVLKDRILTIRKINSHLRLKKMKTKKQEQKIPQTHSPWKLKKKIQYMQSIWI